MPERATPLAGRQALPGPRTGHARRPPDPAAPAAPALPLQGARPAAPGLSRLLAERLLEPSQLLDEAARAVAESLGGPCVISLLARDPHHGTVSSHHSEPAAAALLHDTLQDISRRGGHGAPGRGALVSGRSRLISSDEPTGLHEHVNPAIWPYLEQHPVRGLLWVPLRARGESLGILVVGRDAGRPAFTPDDLARCQDVADRVGLAADNARLLSQARHELAELRRAQAELVQSGERYHALYHGNPVPMFTWQQQDDDLILVDVNAAAVEDSGGAIEKLIGVRASDLFTAADAQLLDDFRQVLTHHQPVHREMTYSLRTSGEMRHLLVTLVYLPVGRVVVHTENLTELRRTEQAYRDLIDRLPAVVYVAEVGPDGSYTFVSPQIRSVLGCSPEQLLADASVWRDRIHPEDSAAVRLAEDRALAGDRHVNVEYRLLHPDGRTLWIRDEAVVRPVDESDPGSALVIQGLMSDITERKEFLGRLQHLADHDALTGLHNRRRFVDDLIDEMARARRDGRPSSLLLIDVDDFKQVNDSLGHPVGDDLIRSLASQLRRRLRRTDALGRLGGDEFAVALPGSDTTEAAAIAEQLRGAVEQAVHPLGPEPIRVTLSIGVADAAGESATADDVLAAADLALYDAKRHGRNQVVVYEPRLTVELATGRSWRLRLQDALEQDRFVMHTQPIVSLTTGQVTQQELLLRLVEEDGTVIEAAEFLPHAERAGMMGAVDRWVVRRAVRLAADHASSGDPGLLAVNLAGSSIGDHGLVDLLRDELDETGADPSLLVFEVTETSAIADMQQAQEFAAALRALGCRLALDDFGSGFASFYYVKHLPFDFLKIDGEFVRGLRDDPLDQAVVAAIVAVARSLGRQTIAEFVGDEQTVTLLRELGVDFAQGYHLGRPAHPAERRSTARPTLPLVMQVTGHDGALSPTSAGGEPDESSSPAVTRRRLLQLGLVLPGAAALAACSGSHPTATAPPGVSTTGPGQGLSAAGSTLERTLLRGAPGVSGFVPLVDGPAEPHRLRTDIGGTAAAQRTHTRAPLLAFAQLTDIHTVDAQSPARVEFLDRADDPPAGDPTFQAAYRPQEMLTAQVADTMAATVRSVGRGPVTQQPLAFAVSTGDAVDNCQANELRWMIDLLDGGRQVRPDSGDTSRWEGVHDADPQHYDEHYWHPGAPPAGRAADLAKTRYGFPTIAGMLDACRRPFTSTGLGIPWYAAYGNHDGLVQGNAAPGPALDALATGSRKVVGLSPGMTPLGFAGALLGGKPLPAGLPSRTVTADPQRRLVSRRETIEAHFDTGGRPRGHGFTATNRREGTAYYTFDPTSVVRCIVLDTVNPGGLSDGSLDATQLSWLRDQLGRAGQRLVVLFSHHTIATMTNPTPAAGETSPRVLGPAVRDLLLAHPSVVLWVNGHTHVNRVTAHRRASGGGFWELNTAAHIDWPQQSRLVELVDNHDGSLSVFGTILDFAAPSADPRRTGSVAELASLSRLLAANDWQERTGHSATVDGRRGQVEDRNVELLVPDPRSGGASTL